MNTKDLTGRTFGRLTVLRRTDEKDKHGRFLWDCLCDCGQSCKVGTSMLTHGLKKSCGCLQDETRRNDVTGQRRGHLTAISPTDKMRKDSVIWRWRCDCGQEIEKPLNRVYDTSICPACARRLKRQQAKTMANNIQRIPGSDTPVGALPGIQTGKLFRNNTSGVRGVSWHQGSKMWIARIQQDKRTVTIGYFSTIEAAAEARREAIKELYGEAPPDKRKP